MFLILYCYIADLIFGDPEGFPHPVRWIGKLISLLDEKLRKQDGIFIQKIGFVIPAKAGIQKLKGSILAVTVVGVTAATAFLLGKVLNKIDPFLGKLFLVYLGYTTISVKDLWVKAKAILAQLENDSIVMARENLAKIVGRDTKDLNEQEIIKATIESIAESTADGIVAPIFYLIIGGPVLAIAYKAVNTLDSMVGYKNEKYLYFGWFSAKLDDVFNFIPARITGLLITVSAFVLCKDFKNAFRIMKRDGRKHSSPNSGISEAGMAGALGLKLGGSSYYNGELIEKPYIGAELNSVKVKLIKQALNISFVVSIFMVLIGVIIKW
jgi:adenosylcobinamide-phosphate synthase